jgi:hypothetical protein
VRQTGKKRRKGEREGSDKKNKGKKEVPPVDKQMKFCFAQRPPGRSICKPSQKA